MKLIALTILVCVVHTVTGWCERMALEKRRFSEFPEPFPKRIRRRFKDVKFDDTDFVAMYQVFPNNERPEMSFYAVCVVTTDDKYVYFKIRVVDGGLDHLSNFTSKDFDDYLYNCRLKNSLPYSR